MIDPKHCATTKLKSHARFKRAAKRGPSSRFVVKREPSSTENEEIIYVSRHRRRCRRFSKETRIKKGDEWGAKKEFVRREIVGVGLPRYSVPTSAVFCQVKKFQQRKKEPI